MRNLGTKIDESRDIYTKRWEMNEEIELDERVNRDERDDSRAGDLWDDPVIHF